MPKKRSRLSETEIRQRATAWAEETFASGVHIAAVIVEYDPWSYERRGRRSSAGIVRAGTRLLEAAELGDIPAARAAMQSAEQAADPGFAFCENRESLAEVLAERLRRGEYCYLERDFHESVAGLIIWRE